MKTIEVIKFMAYLTDIGLSYGDVKPAYEKLEEAIRCLQHPMIIGV